MSMKSTDSPRRVYTRKGACIVCFEGRYYGTSSDSAVRDNVTVTCEKLPSDGGRARIQVTQRRPHAKTVVEVWRSFTLPAKA